ncbi:GGDEF domain-containing protein [Pseudomonas rhizoryzae]|uniref:GGDEF domain-containing protein n=1 Tax=Pseudomonas rhizoryzae TaxID=2571129 RepID=UPI0007377690|nr:GGDEF domain-containing protein [Pseudomonas rhizoryzae]KTT31510.1 diguanylate cyclase [Pseudomonas psychrotolerans]KTT32030.1 diguanylate cyclase [Pseudomonas psychrotolerans]KTT75777.1 diguanylate cyclase [Pseudomonas psychrotolerans]
MERADVERWKNKYLESLENQERLESRWENRLDLVRRGLVRSSLAAEGNDAAVDACLVELRDILRRDDSDADLAKLIPRLERTVLDSEQRRELRTRQVAEAFAELCRLLLTLELPRDQRKALKGFAKRAQAAAGQPGELPALLGEFSRLQQQALSALQPDQPARPGFLQRLLGGRGEQAEDSAAPLAEAAATVAADPAVAELPSPAEQPATALGESAPVSLEPAASADPAYALPPVPEPGYSAIAPHLEATLLRLLDDLALPDSHKPQAEQLRQRIQGSLNWYELVPVLDDLSILVLALNHSGQSEFQHYLRQLNERLSAFQTGLQDIHVERQDGQTQERAFGDALRGQVNELQTEVQDATDLDSLKLSLDARLEGLLSSLADQQSQRETREQAANERLTALTERVTTMEREAQQYRGHLEEQRQKALCDPLTGLPNRAAWSERLELEVALWQRHGGDLLLAVLDVDLFKRINDGYGHLAGDKVLKIIGGELQRRLRKTDFIARFGGEEFVLLLGATPIAGGVTLLEQLRAAVAACPFHFKGERVVITLSAGLAAFAPGEDADTVFERADQALYRAKRAGRDRLEVA